MPETYILTKGYGRGTTYLYRVTSETEKTYKAIELLSSGWAHRTSTVAKDKVLGIFADEDAAKSAQKRGKAAWDRASGPVGDAERILREREVRRNKEWIAALSPAEPTGGEQ